jgi:paired amphipathic helix protein Sin3a
MNGNIPNPNERGVFDGAARVVWQHQQPGGAPEAGFSSEGRAAPQAGYGAQGGPTSHPPHSPEAYREQQAAAAAAAIHQQEQRNVAHLQNAASAASAAALSGRGGVMSSPGDAIASLQPHLLNGVSPGTQQAMANGGVEKRGPVEFNHAISYVNKIKVPSLTLSRLFID